MILDTETWLTLIDTRLEPSRLMPRMLNKFQEGAKRDMRINKDHLYHGAALTQIAEHPRYTSINAFRYQRKNSRSAFKVNDTIGLYLKYATEPSPGGRYKEYLFNFRSQHFRELRQLKKGTANIFVGLICVRDKEICCLHYDELIELVKERQQELMGFEDQYAILVKLSQGSSFRVYLNQPGTKGKALNHFVIPRRNFPARLFEKYA